MLLSTEIEDPSSNILTRLVELTFSSPIPLYRPTLKDLLSIEPTSAEPGVETLTRVLDGFQIDLLSLRLEGEDPGRTLDCDELKRVDKRCDSSRLGEVVEAALNSRIQQAERLLDSAREMEDLIAVKLRLWNNNEQPHLGCQRFQMACQSAAMQRGEICGGLIVTIIAPEFRVEVQ
ncbi:hypothetical protein Tco_0678985 [Tanacetum coccineum]|uniref:Uncharacterized protein n=1 Tax=Tanacetum coccineum TaxID=301880 RepID=A0ABQ4XGL3_9ASTR